MQKVDTNQAPDSKWVCASVLLQLDGGPESNIFRLVVLQGFGNGYSADADGNVTGGGAVCMIITRNPEMQSNEKTRIAEILEHKKRVL